MSIFIFKQREIRHLIDYAIQHTKIPTGTTAIFKLYNRCSEVSLNFTPALPYFQLQFEKSGQVTTPFVKLSDFGMFGFCNGVGVMTDCQYSGRTMHMIACK